MDIKTDPVTTSITTTQTVITTEVTTRAIPTLCDPKNFKSYRRATSDTRDVKLKSVPLTTKEDCCVRCYNEGNCIYFVLANISGEAQCNYRIITEMLNYTLSWDSPVVRRDDICPLGITPGSAMVWPDSLVGAEHGPCLSTSPLSGDVDG